MPTQKTFKQRVRTRMTKTGESYTAARRQLLQKAADDAPSDAATEVAAGQQPAAEAAINPDDFVVSDEAVLRSTGKRHAEWFALLDTWGATTHNHTAIARWLREEQGVAPWWTQGITVAYERARGIRARHEVAGGYSVSATRTVTAEADRALAAFTDPAVRDRWLPEAPMERRPTRAALTARFDWSEPPSRVVVSVAPKGVDRSAVTVTHEHLPDQAAADRLKATWRARLGELTDLLERS